MTCVNRIICKTDNVIIKKLITRRKWFYGADTWYTRLTTKLWNVFTRKEPCVASNELTRGLLRVIKVAKLRITLVELRMNWLGLLRRFETLLRIKRLVCQLTNWLGLLVHSISKWRNNIQEPYIHTNERIIIGTIIDNYWLIKKGKARFLSLKEYATRI